MSAVADYGSPCKTVLERYFAEFLAFFFPEAHTGIDWTQGYTLYRRLRDRATRRNWG